MVDLIIFLDLLYLLVMTITYVSTTKKDKRIQLDLLLALLVTYVRILFPFPYSLKGLPLRIQFSASVCSSNYIFGYCFIEHFFLSKLVNPRIVSRAGWFCCFVISNYSYSRLLKFSLINEKIIFAHFMFVIYAQFMLIVVLCFLTCTYVLIIIFALLSITCVSFAGVVIPSLCLCKWAVSYLNQALVPVAFFYFGFVNFHIHLSIRMAFHVLINISY